MWTFRRRPSKVEIFPSVKMPTPFGSITLARIEPPKLARPELDSRRRKAVKHAVAMDLTSVLGYIPWVGSLVGEQLSDLHYASMKDILTERELKDFTKADKEVPTNVLALLSSFIK
mgnify:CR=1 FL=1